jgi:hypothetical protein
MENLVRFYKMKPVIRPALIAMIITASMVRIFAGDNNLSLAVGILLLPISDIERSNDEIALNDLSNPASNDDKPDTADTNHDIRPTDPMKNKPPIQGNVAIANKDSAAMDSQFLGEIKKYPLGEVSSQSRTLELSIKLPAGMKFNHLAPFNITMSSNNSEVIKPGKFNITKGSRKFKIPVAVGPGEAILTIDLNFSYCEIAHAALCYFKNARLEIPVKVVKSGGKVFSVKYEVFD